MLTMVTTISGVSASYAVSLVAMIHLAHADCGDARVRNFTNEHVKRCARQVRLAERGQQEAESHTQRVPLGDGRKRVQGSHRGRPHAAVKFLPTNSEGGLLK